MLKNADLQQAYKSLAEAMEILPNTESFDETKLPELKEHFSDMISNVGCALDALKRARRALCRR